MTGKNFLNELAIKDELYEKRIEKMNKKAYKFAKMCIECEWDFTKTLIDFGEGVAINFTILERNKKKINVFFAENNYVGIECIDEELE